ncbi:hypothetical protein Micbo1qcDRAFT_158560 [Microdochium bolleyi]|uniref:RRM domain-containing protein n=1 Tax=Microdochium bolleyi TaxID=196109 RepID=A0A136J979_9PEZI|nr:hypothetical protein Micbo1qcDRAFT_158560 [Microdochium bolleyi]
MGAKSEKRRRDIADVDGDGADDGGYDFETPAGERKAKKPKKEKKDGKKKGDNNKFKKAPREEPSALPALDADEAGESAQVQDADEGAQKKPAVVTEGTKKKKAKKAKKPVDQAAKDTDTAATAATAEGSAAENDNEEGQQKEKPSNTSGKKSRFIVFVGNLPYSATVPQIQEHFASLQPTSIRLLHEKTNPSKSRGIAFVEFAGYDHMKTCLRTMHHSTFTGTATNPKTGKSWPDERRINVELTAGGGGNTAARKDKIKQKNVKLNEQRIRRMEAEEKAKHERRSNGAPNSGGPQQETGGDGVHPSRRGRVNGGR